jgi:hypothetical protein
LLERINELARNSVGEMASCLAGIAEKDLARGASAGEVDVQFLVKSLLWMFFHDGWIYAYPCPLCTVIFLKMTNYLLFSLPRFLFLILWSMS